MIIILVQVGSCFTEWLPGNYLCSTFKLQHLQCPLDGCSSPGTVRDKPVWFSSPYICRSTPPQRTASPPSGCRWRRCSTGWYTPVWTPRCIILNSASAQSTDQERFNFHFFFSLPSHFEINCEIDFQRPDVANEGTSCDRTSEELRRSVL